MSCFQRIVAYRASSGETDVNDGSPALQFVVTVTMEKIGGADGNTGGTCLDEREAGVIIDDVVGQKYFLAAAAPHVQGRKIVQSAGGGDSSE